MSLDNTVFKTPHILQDALDAAQNGIIVTDNQQPDNPIIYCNAMFETMTGYSAEEIIGNNCRFLQGTDRMQLERDIIKTAVKEGTACRVEIRNYKKNGQLFYNELYIAPVKNNLGIVTHFIGIQNDITKRINAQDDLVNEKYIAEAAVVEKNKLIVESRIYVSSILETLTEAIVILDESLQIVEANKAFYAMFKTSVKETYGEVIYKFGNGILNIEPVRHLIEKVLPLQSPFDNYIIDFDFKTIGHKVLSVNAKKIVSKDFYRNRILFAIKDITV